MRKHADLSRLASGATDRANAGLPADCTAIVLLITHGQPDVVLMKDQRLSAADMVMILKSAIALYEEGVT